MYHQQQLHSHKQHLSSRPGLPPEKQFLLQGGGGDAGLILSTDAKPRLKWTPELHERFVEAVHQLGGPDSEYTYDRNLYLALIIHDTWHMAEKPETQ